jgi:hypothetical protein
VGAVAVEAAFQFEPPPRDVEPWEIHSELVLVSPEVYERALELLPERDPDAFLTRLPRDVAALPAAEPSLPTALVSYTVLRIAETARSALIVTGFVVALALIAQISH